LDCCREIFLEKKTYAGIDTREVSYKNLIIVFGCLAGRGVAAASNIAKKL